MTYGACAIDGRYRRMDGRAFGFSGEGKGLKAARSKKCIKQNKQTCRACRHTKNEQG